MADFSPLSARWKYLYRRKEAPLFCRFTSDAIYFSETKEVNHFDEGGKITQTTTENVACGQYTYLIKENKIQIDNQIFTITDTNGTLVLQNEDWKLVLVENKHIYYGNIQ